MKRLKMPHVQERGFSDSEYPSPAVPPTPTKAVICELTGYGNVKHMSR